MSVPPWRGLWQKHRRITKSVDKCAIKMLFNSQQFARSSRRGRMKNQDKKQERITGITEQVNIRLRKDTIAWAKKKINKRATSVPAVARQIVEEAQDADEQKKGG